MWLVHGTVMNAPCTCACAYSSLMFGSSKHGEASEAVQISAETPGEVGSCCVWCELNLAWTIYVHVHVFT